MSSLGIGVLLLIGIGVLFILPKIQQAQAFTNDFQAGAPLTVVNLPQPVIVQAPKRLTREELLSIIPFGISAKDPTPLFIRIQEEIRKATQIFDGSKILNF